MIIKHILPLGLALTIASLPAQTTKRYAITQAKGSDTFGAKSTGQTFTPNVGILPNPGTPKTLPLEKVTFYHGNFKSSAPSATTYLNIYDGDPNKSGKFVGSSINAIDTRNLKFRDPMIWSFKKLALNFTTKYWAVMSSTNAAGGLKLAVSLETEARTGNSYAGGAGLIANIAEHPQGVDAKFTIDFFTGVQGIFTIRGTGCAGSAGVPKIAAPCLPQIGRPVRVEFSNLATSSTLLMIVGFSDKTWSGTALPVAVSKLIPGTAAGCTLYTSLDLLQRLPVTGTSAAFAAKVPNVPALFGVTLFVQGAQGESSGRLSMTPMGRVFVGQ